MKTRIRAWYHTGGSWSRLATAVGSPACLCFLPSGVNIVPGQRPIHASDYRDLPMPQVNFLGTLLSALRPYRGTGVPKSISSGGETISERHHGK
jgi:hypothetical protein